VTPEGRALAAAIMVAGVGLFGTFSGFVASWFLKPGSEEASAEREELRAEVERLRAALEEKARR